MNKLYSGSLVILCLLIPILTFAAYIFYYALNVPYNDDATLFGTINKVHIPEVSILSTMMEQHNEHRIVFSRLAMTFVDFVTGNMNFRYVIILGFLNLVILAYAFFLIFISTGNKMVFFIPVVILLFSAIVQATHLWAMTSFEHALSIAFALLSLFFVQPSRQKIWFYSIPFAVAATLSNLDGLCVLPVALVWLILQKRRTESVIFGSFMAIYFYFFFQDFHFSKSMVFPPLVELTGILFKGVLAFIGSIAKVISDSHAYALSLLFGGLIVSVFLVVFIKKVITQKKCENIILPLNFSDIAILQLFASSLMIALGRAGDAAGSMVAIRFQVYSVSILILFYLFVLNNIKSQKVKKLFFSAFLMGSVALNLLSYAKYDNAVNHHNNELRADSYNYANHSLFIYQFANSPDPGRSFFKHYLFPVFFKDEDVNQWRQQTVNNPDTDEVTFSSKILHDVPEFNESIYPTLNLQLGNMPATMSREQVYIAFFSPIKNSKPYLAAVRITRKGWLQGFIDKSAASPISTSISINNKLPEGLYNVALCWKNGQNANSIVLAKNFMISKK